MIESIFRRMPAVLLLLVSLALLGCEATGPTTRLDADEERLPDDYGVVAVQVVSNTTRLSPMLWGWSGILAVDTQDLENQHVIHRGGNGLARSQLFIGALPPGEYRFYGLAAVRLIGDVRYMLRVPVPVSVGSFRIGQNRVTSLGTLVYQPLGSTSDLEEGDEYPPFIIARYDDNDDLRPFIAEAYPERMAEFDRSSYLGWTNPPDDRFEDNMLDVLREAAVPSTYQRQGSEIVAPARLGQVFFRDERSGNWTRSDTGQTVQLLHVSRTSSGWLAGGERGVFLEAAERAGPWRRVQGPSSQRALVWVHESSNGTRYALGRGGEPWVELFRQQRGGDWVHLQSFEDISPNPVLQTQDRLMLFHENMRYTYDLNSGQQVEARRSVRNRQDFGILKQPDGALVSRPGTNGFGDPGRAHYSLDWGDRWKRTKLDGMRETRRPATFTTSFLFSDRSELTVAHRGIEHPVTDRVEYEEEARLRRMPEGSGPPTWLGVVTPECSNLEPQISTDQAIYMSCIDGRLLVSRDGGESFELEYEPGETSELPTQDLDDGLI